MTSQPTQKSRLEQALFPSLRCRGLRISSPASNAIVAVFCGTLLGCGGSLPVASEATLSAARGVPIGSLPPPALPEEIPERADNQSHLVWTDGCWEWSIGRWIWVRGGWVDAPQDGAHFRGKVVFDANGGLLWIPCSWIVNGEQLGLITPAVPARYPVSSRSVAR